MEVQPLVASAFEGFHQGTLIVDGSQPLHFLVSDKTAHVLFLLSPAAIDVGLPVDSVTTLLEEERRLARIEEEKRYKALLQLSDGMASRGPGDAPVTIFEFSDFQCPYCARAFTTIEELLKQYPEDIRFVYLHLPLSHHEWAKPAAIAAVCAANQSEEAFWALHDSYFRNQREVTRENVIEISRRYLQGSGIDLGVWAECASNTASEDYWSAASAVEASVEAAGSEFGITGTPGFFVNGRLLYGAQSIEAFEALIDEFLHKPDPE